MLKYTYLFYIMNLNYQKLLNEKYFISFLKSIEDCDKDPTIVYSAKKIAFEITGNKNIAPWPYYDILFKKYKFKISTTQSNGKLKVNLYSLNGDSINLIGTMYPSGQNPYVKNTITPPHVPPPTNPPGNAIIVKYIVNDKNQYIVNDQGKYLYISDTPNINPSDPTI